MPPSPAPVADWGRLIAALNSATALAPIGGRQSSPAGDTLLAKIWSRLEYAGSQVFSSKQKRFNLEMAEAVHGLFVAMGETQRSVSAAVNCLQDQVHALQNDQGHAQHVAQQLVAFQAQLEQLRSAVEPLHFRPGTMDEAIFEGVARSNEYQLPDRLAATDVVIDIGAHIGSFSYACLQRGAGKAFAYEASPENYALAAVNLSRFGKRAEVTHAAIWRSDVNTKSLSFTASHVADNTGAGNVLCSTGVPVDAIGLDAILTDLPRRCGRERVRAIKIDCEGSEFPILLTSKRLDLVDEIVGEYHEFRGWEPMAAAKVADYPQFTCEVLVGYLERAGFRVKTTPYTESMGAFFARRAA